jgi:hypothetical protein
MSLVRELSRRAAASRRPLSRLSKGVDRYGPVEAINLHNTGHVSVRRCGDGFHVTVWDRDELVAEGRTPSVDDIVRTMQDWQGRMSIDTSPYLTPLDRRMAADALWRLLDEHGEAYLRPVFEAAAAHPTLRALRPWVSHGTLHLVHAEDSWSAERRRSLALHPTSKAASW